VTHSRLNPWPILRAHWRGLGRGDRRTSATELGERLVVVATLLLWVPALYWNWKLSAPEPMFAGVSLLAGALLAAFGFLATVRLRLQYRDPHPGSSGTQRAKEHLDESVSHLLAAAVICLVDAVALVIGMNITSDPAGALVGVMAAIVIALSSYLVVLFLMLMTRLYAAYVDTVRAMSATDS
jgi:hypothetical protein